MPSFKPETCEDVEDDEDEAPLALDAGIMPRRLEIRTTILGKKSDERSRKKDANANDLYADEALQLLEEIEQLKSNIQKTDERILGTYTKSPCKAKKKKPEVPARKVVYDVFYPAMGEC
ncbi:hypothetical protein DAPPUDRAFT_96002 [Daphnia pulex]|uniref:Uncharacterized protein n=1 Tax=Daphnia pulex TaxID=6669 RepID=E9FWM5_DAPPU|nr:hypothetical protein DAPPUDRAFT_96002 [Daphnia pulex]|eukprot:EFX88406.1 hypothetical protein DAPPUDRAFT_96002 [Daphnia pulex]